MNLTAFTRNMILNELRQNNCSFAKVAHIVGVTEGTVRKVYEQSKAKEFASVEKRAHLKTNGKSTQPCWTCAKACGGCNWSDELKPVDGWEAEEFIIKSGKLLPLLSYRITKCPEYEKDC